MLNKIFILGVLFFSSIYVSNAASIEDNILPKKTTETLVDSTIIVKNDGTGIIANLLAYFKESIFSLIMVIAIGVFLYIGFKLVMAKGNPEEFKKAIQSFVYAIVGMVIVGLAWALVTFISGLKLN